MNFLFAICNAQSMVKVKAHVQQAFRRLKILNVKKVLLYMQLILKV